MTTAAETETKTKDAKEAKDVPQDAAGQATFAVFRFGVIQKGALSSTSVAALGVDQDDARTNLIACLVALYPNDADGNPTYDIIAGGTLAVEGVYTKDSATGTPPVKHHPAHTQAAPHEPAKPAPSPSTPLRSTR